MLALMNAISTRTVRANGLTFTLDDFRLEGIRLPDETLHQAVIRRKHIPMRLEYEVKAVNGDLSVAERESGICGRTEARQVRMRFTQPGVGKVVFQGRTDQGVGAFAEGGDLEFEVE